MMSQGIEKRSLRDCNAFMAPHQVDVMGIHKMRLKMSAIAAGNRLGNEMIMAVSDVSSHIQKVRDDMPKKVRYPLRR
jgi:hypothetical protein